MGIAPLLNYTPGCEIWYPFTGCVKAPKYCKIKPWKSSKHLKFKLKHSKPGLLKLRNTLRFFKLTCKTCKPRWQNFKPNSMPILKIVASHPQATRPSKDHLKRLKKR